MSASKSYCRYGTANLEKAWAMQDQVALSLFTMLDESLLSDKQEYLELRREDAMARLRCWMAADKVAEMRKLAD